MKPTPPPTPKPRPKPKVAVVAQRQPARASTPTSTGHSVRGQASWYCKTGVSACASGYPGGMYAAAGPAIRVGNWRGRTVRVCRDGSCISVKLIDWCACGGGRIIDLYSDAFRRLGPLSSGTMTVRVSW